jgi:hypothetical protein
MCEWLEFYRSCEGSGGWPVRVSNTGKFETFKTVVEKICAHVHAALQHQHISFTQIGVVEEVKSN